MDPRKIQVFSLMNRASTEREYLFIRRPLHSGRRGVDYRESTNKFDESHTSSYNTKDFPEFWWKEIVQPNEPLETSNQINKASLVRTIDMYITTFVTENHYPVSRMD